MKTEDVPPKFQEELKQALQFFLEESSKKYPEEELLRISEMMSLNFQIVQERANVLREVNPMLGHRGCRLAITYPEIYQMQVKAILKALEPA